MFEHCSFLIFNFLIHKSSTKDVHNIIKLCYIWGTEQLRTTRFCGCEGKANRLLLGSPLGPNRRNVRGQLRQCSAPRSLPNLLLSMPPKNGLNQRNYIPYRKLLSPITIICTEPTMDSQA